MSVLSDYERAANVFAGIAPSAPPYNPLWRSSFMSCPQQQTMSKEANPDFLEWRGGEMLSVRQNNVEVLYFRRHSLGPTLYPCAHRYNFFRAAGASISYEVHGRCCCEAYHLVVDDDTVAKLKTANLCENGCGYACGLMSSAPPIATLGTISIHGESRFRILRKVDKDAKCECSPCSCSQPSAYSVVSQPIFDSAKGIPRDFAKGSALREQITKLRARILDLEISEDTGTHQELASLRTEEKSLTAELRTLWQHTALLSPVARSESLLRRANCLCWWWWEPVRIVVSPEAPGLTSDEMLAAGLLSIAHLSRGIGGPVLNASDEDLGASRHKLSFDDMLSHQLRHEIGAARITAVSVDVASKGIFPTTSTDSKSNSSHESIEGERFMECMTQPVQVELKV